VIPLILGLPASEAIPRLEATGVAVSVVTQAEANPDDAARRPGAVWMQDPAAGADATGTVTIWVNP
jgi:beta-lactam-binding protein with PASTA domain